jgi:hypothetical protein
MEASKVIRISVAVVTFFLKNENSDISMVYRNMIKIYLPELWSYLNNDDFLCEEYTAMMIVHRVNGVATPKNDPGFVFRMLDSINCTIDEFGEWVEQIKSDNQNGIVFGLQNFSPTSSMN